MNQQEIVERAEFMKSFLNFDGRKMVKIELRFDKEVVSADRMDDLNRQFESLLESEHLGQMTFSELQAECPSLHWS